jgi:hypothetical protein
MTVYCDVVVMTMLDAVGVAGMKETSDAAQVEAGVVVVQESVTGEAKPATGVTVAVVSIPRPEMMLPEVEMRVMVKSTPLPVS